MYYIWDKKTERTIGYYETKEAADETVVRWCQYYASYSLADFAVKERDDSPECMEARLLLDDGTYPQPVWHNQSWYQERFEDIKTFAHVDIEKPENILFFENKEKLAKGRTTSTKPGRFLKKYFADILSEQDILDWTERHKEQWLDGDELSWARTPEEIAAVYSMEATFNSCMQYKWYEGKGNSSAGWPADLPCHPTYVYGAGDLAVAYLHKGDRLIGRALVWEDKKKVGRVYGDIVGMRNALRKYGIVTNSNQNTYDTFAGARILRIPFPYNTEETGEYDEDYPLQPRMVAPYIDGAIDGLGYGDDERYLIITDQEYEEEWMRPKNPQPFKAQEPCGYVVGSTTCPCCNKMRRHFYPVQSRNDAGEQVRIHWCDWCLNDKTHYSPRTGERYDRRHFNSIRVSQYTYWGETGTQAIEGLEDIVETSERYQPWRYRNQCTEVEGKFFGNHVLHQYAFESSMDRRLYLLTNRSTEHVGYPHLALTNEQAETLPSGASYMTLLDQWRDEAHEKATTESLFNV